MASEHRLEPWPIVLVCALLAMISASLTFFAIASRHPDPLVVEDAYEAGLRYNAQLRERARGEALGLSLQVRAEPRDGGVQVEVVARDADGAVAADHVIVRRERPAEGGLDRDFELSVGSGPQPRHEGRVDLPRPGRWHLQVIASLGDLALRERLTLQVPGTAVVRDGGIR